jgi:4-carboxymuconolactone decarboxylase
MTARIPPPAPHELSEDVASLLALTAPPGGEPPGTMALLARRPQLLSPFLGWAAALALEGVLPQRDHELLALRVVWNCRSAFEWGEHSEYGRAAGLDDADLARVARGADAPGWSAHEVALLRAADELHTRCAVADDTWAVLADHYETPALVEIPFVVGQYTMLSMVANAAGVEPGPGFDPLPEP